MLCFVFLQVIAQVGLQRPPAKRTIGASVMRKMKQVVSSFWNNVTNTSEQILGHKVIQLEVLVNLEEDRLQFLLYINNTEHE
jgi:hypothetical protein